MQVTYAPDEPRLFWLQEKPEDPQFELHARIKMAEVLGCPLYICGWNPFVHDKSEIRDTACAMKLTRGVLRSLIKKSMVQRN